MTDETVNRVLDLVEKYGGAAFTMYLIYAAIVLVLFIIITVYVVHKITGSINYFSNIKYKIHMTDTYKKSKGGKAKWR